MGRFQNTNVAFVKASVLSMPFLLSLKKWKLLVIAKNFAQLLLQIYRKLYLKLYLPRPLSHCMLMDSIETRQSLSNKNLIDKILKILWLP